MDVKNCHNTNSIFNHNEYYLKSDVESELDKLKADNQQLKDDCDELQDRANNNLLDAEVLAEESKKLKADNERLRGYADHKRVCELMLKNNVIGKNEKTCDCGLDELLNNKE